MHNETKNGVAPAIGATTLQPLGEIAKSTFTQALPLSVYLVLLHHLLTCCCCHSVHVHTLPRVVQAPVACESQAVTSHIRTLVFKHYSFPSHSEACILSVSLCVLGRVRLRAWVPTSQRESHSQWNSSCRVGQGPRLTLYSIHFCYFCTVQKLELILHLI